MITLSPNLSPPTHPGIWPNTVKFNTFEQMEMVLGYSIYGVLLQELVFAPFQICCGECSPLMMKNALFEKCHWCNAPLKRLIFVWQILWKRFILPAAGKYSCTLWSSLSRWRLWPLLDTSVSDPHGRNFQKEMEQLLCLAQFAREANWMESLVKLVWYFKCQSFSFPK